MVKETEKKTVKAAAKKPIKKKEPKKKVAPILEAAPETVVEAAVPTVAPQVQAQAQAQAQVSEPAVQHAPKPKNKPAIPQGALYSATGRRKTSIARVKLSPGNGEILINRRPLMVYLANRDVLGILVKKPLVITDTLTKYDVFAKVEGGGVASQAGAISHGIARALLTVSPDFRGKLKSEGLLTRDPRMKERKKYGRKKARKRFQYSKR